MWLRTHLNIRLKSKAVFPFFLPDIYSKRLNPLPTKLWVTILVGVGNDTETNNIIYANGDSKSPFLCTQKTEVQVKSSYASEGK